MPDQTTMTPYQLVTYYANLLILQYLSKPKAYATMFLKLAPIVMPQTTVQQLNFSDVAASGSFVIQLIPGQSVTVSWNESSSSIQTAIRALTGYSSVTVSGSIASEALAITFTSVPAPVVPVTILTNTLLNGSSVGVIIDVEQTDQILLLEIQNAFNLIGPNKAKGVQLDILGKYIGVSRYFSNFTLSDEDFITVMGFAIAQNNSSSTLSAIQTNLYNIFPGEYYLQDNTDMTMSYIFNSTLININVFSAILSEGLIPKPIAVEVTVILIPVINKVFGFSTYDRLNTQVQGFNTYDVYNTSWIWLTYDDVINVS
jgi:hypothetical protein